MTKTAESAAPKKVSGLDPNKYMIASYYGTYIVPDENRLDKKREKKFRCKIVVPKSLLKHNFNFHSHFKYTQKQAFVNKYPDFIRFKKVIFDQAHELDGSEIRDPRTYSLERLKQYCMDKEYDIDFDLYPGLQLRNIIEQFFERRDRVDEREAFYRKQAHDKQVRGLNAELRAEAELIPEGVRIEFEED